MKNRYNIKTYNIKIREGEKKNKKFNCKEQIFFLLKNPTPFMLMMMRYSFQNSITDTYMYVCGNLFNFFFILLTKEKQAILIIVFSTIFIIIFFI